MGKIRGTHSSPGVYTQFTDLTYASKTLGITTLGIVGETLKGPAFEPINVSDWAEYQSYFGGTSAELFKGSKYPKYELPYIAKSYLKASDQLVVCRVLGLSGYNAGPAWAIVAEGEDGKKYVVAVLRSRGEYNKYAAYGDPCNGGSTKYDALEYFCDKITIEPYTNVYISTMCNDFDSEASTEDEILINSLNLGQFTIVAYKNDCEIGRYPVTLNNGTKDYIYNILGGNPTDGTAALFVEELYDMYLQELVDSRKVYKINTDENKLHDLSINAVSEPISDFVTIPYNKLTRANLGQTFLAEVNGSTSAEDDNSIYQYMGTDENGDVTKTYYAMEVGTLYTVKAYLDAEKGKQYTYVQKKDADGNVIKVGYIVPGTGNEPDTVDAVKLLSYNRFFHLAVNADEESEVVPCASTSDYHDQFRCASTPWIVSELKGDGKDLQVKKLFRFHTISDGTCANSQVKISIANIKPDAGTFDVYVRDFNDGDGSPIILESYRNLTMVPGNKNYIGLKIGTVDGRYETVSKYILVEVVENDMTENCVPCGFLGYPVRDYSSIGAEAPSFSYVRSYDEDVNVRKQYFGLSDNNVDIDMLSYKGKNAYTENYGIGYTKSFHLDSRLNPEVIDSIGTNVTVDGDASTLDMKWDAVSIDNGSIPPIIGSEFEMEGTLYEDVKTRKFTVYPCGGFDGWDIYRTSRTTGDEFKASKYKGTIKNGNGGTFSKIYNADVLALHGNSITSDYYAFLAGANQFEIPEQNVINLFATPGIDYVNSKFLTDEILEMITEKRGDSLYVVTTPDKPFGASDARDEMYTSVDAASNLEDSGLDTYYAATYYPWVKYFDKDNNIYINLPATKDVLRNMADVDNKRYPWWAPAGLERGNVDCVKMHFFAKLEDEDNVYDNRINPLKTFSEDGVKVWGNKTLLVDETGNNPMNRVNTVRLMLYLRKLIKAAGLKLIFDPNDITMKKDFEAILDPILMGIKNNRGITDYKLVVSQTPEQMDAHELSARIWVKPTPTLEYIEIEFMVTPQGVEFMD